MKAAGVRCGDVHCAGVRLIARVIVVVGGWDGVHDLRRINLGQYE